MQHLLSTNILKFKKNWKAEKSENRVDLLYVAKKRVDLLSWGWYCTVIFFDRISQTTLFIYLFIIYVETHVVAAKDDGEKNFDIPEP